MRPEVENKMANLAAHLRVDLSVNGRPHIIEAGTFESRQEAMELIARLNKLGFRAYIVRRHRGGDSFNSVRLGPYDSRNSALATADQLREEAGVEVKLLPQGGQF
jgi:cell division septation protein DedD